jgi:Carboxypeptidase regulatory-like domain
LRKPTILAFSAAGFVTVFRTDKNVGSIEMSSKSFRPAGNFYRLALLSILAVTAALGQTFRGGISGTVADATGGVLSGAMVKIEQNGTGLTRSMPTTSAGIFAFPELPAGSYTVMVSYAGFRTQRVEDVEVQVGTITSLPITLNVAVKAETVEVSAHSATVEANESALNAVVGTRAIQEIPLNGRDFSQLLVLTPGFNQFGSMNGNRPDQNNWQIDGIDNNDFWINVLAVNQGSVSGIPGVLLPIDAIEEFNHQSLGGADFGRNPGSMVNVVIKSGTNALHGTAYYFHRNDALAKASPFIPPGSPDKLRNHNFGFSFGGPIIEDKAFFFVAGEGQRFIAGNEILATTPSDAWVARAESVLSAFHVPVNPVMTNLLANLWPNSMRSAPATSPNFFSSANNDYRSNNLVARIDYAFNPRERFFLRSFIGSGDATAFSGSVYPDYFESVPSRQENWAAVLNSTFTPRLINQVLFGVNYFLTTFNDANHSANPPALGLNTGITSANFGTPNIEINGFGNGGVGESSATGRTDTTWQITDDLNYTFGGHTLKFGGEFRRSKLWIHYLRFARGGFFFDGTAGPWAGSPQLTTEDVALADFLAGFIPIGNAGIVIGDPRRNYYVNSSSWYAHDNWQVTPRLNINFGLRYEYNGPLYDPTHSISTFLPTAPGGLAFPPQIISSLYPRDLNNFAPRLGFAFSPLRGGHTVIRGAWGVYYDIPSGGLFIDNNGGVASNPGGPKPVFAIFSTNPITVVAGQYLFGNITPTPPFAAFGVDQNLRSPYVQNFSLNVQQQLKPRIMLQVGYVGSQGRKLPISRNINQPAASPTPYPDLEAARPFHALFPQFSYINEISTVGDSQFNSLQVSLRAGRWHSLTGQIAYTLGHARDDRSFARFNNPTDNNNLRGDYGNALFDTRHNVSGYLLYDVPQLVHARPRLTKGWELATFLSYDSGFPFSVFSGLGGRDTGSNTGNGSDRADLVGDPFSGLRQPTQPQGGLTSGVLWINPTAFALNAPGTFGNTKRNQFYGPPFKAIDFSVIKNTPITERVKAQFRVEMFNVFNILNLAPPSSCICDGGQFGLISSTLHAVDAPGIGAGEPLNVQLALKLIW